MRNGLRAVLSEGVPKQQPKILIQEANKLGEKADRNLDILAACTADHIKDPELTLSTNAACFLDRVFDENCLSRDGINSVGTVFREQIALTTAINCSKPEKLPPIRIDAIPYSFYFLGRMYAHLDEEFRKQLEAVIEKAKTADRKRSRKILPQDSLEQFRKLMIYYQNPEC